MDIEEARANERARAGFGRGRTLADEFHLEAAFLARFAERGLLGVFVQFDVPAQRKPAVELAVMDEQHAALVDDKNGHGKIYLLVNVRHGAGVNHGKRAADNSGVRGGIWSLSGPDFARPASWFVVGWRGMSPNPAPLLTDLLARVSRSFYTTLRVLPGSIRRQISLAYLLARASDTIADTELIPVAGRLEALRQLRERIAGQRAQLRLSALSQAQASAAERELLERIEEAMALLDKFSAADQEAIRDVLGTITGGQALDLERFAGGSECRIAALANEAELDDYTYRVAGCVGEFWTRLCVAHVFGERGGEFVQRGIRFGKGLQLVNILRDLPRDLRQGRCYLPLDGLAALGLKPEDLLDPATELQMRPLYNALLNRAQDHLAAGWAYTTSIPWHCVRLRLACAWPVLIGVRTLELLRRANPLDPARRVKISRPAVRAILVRSVLWYPVPPLWRELAEEARG